jgi:protein gp37
MESCPTNHQFQMLTKNPERIPTDNVVPADSNEMTIYKYPGNWWFGTTVTGDHDTINIAAIKKVPAKIRFVSFEPLLGTIAFDLLPKICSLEGIQWVIIGKLTGSKRVKLQWEWVKNILEEAEKHSIPVFMKNNLIPETIGQHELRQEFPQ